MAVGQRGLIFEAHCAYSKISPSPVWGMSTGEKGGGGVIFGRVWYYSEFFIKDLHNM